MPLFSFFIGKASLIVRFSRWARPRCGRMLARRPRGAGPVRRKRRRRRCTGRAIIARKEPTACRLSAGRTDGCRPSQGGRTLRGSGWDGCIAWFTGWEEQSWKRPCRSGLRAVRPGSPSYRAPRRASTAKSARRTRYAERGALRRSDAVQANGPRRRARASRVRRARCGPNARAPRGSARAARGQRGRRGHTGTFPRQCRAGCAMRPPRAPAGRRTAGRRTSRGG